MMSLKIENSENLSIKYKVRVLGLPWLKNPPLGSLVVKMRLLGFYVIMESHI